MTAFSQRVLVTGGAGFMGSHFLNTIVPKYPNVHFTCIDKLNYASYHSTKLIKVMDRENFEFIEKDLSADLEFLKEITSTIDSIVHFAAESCVDRSFTDPLYFTLNNITAAQNLLECCRLLRETRSKEVLFLHISTDEVYGEQIQDNEFVNEGSRLDPTNPYAASKAATDLIIGSYSHSYGLPITILRSNNVYGPGQYPEKLVPVTIQTLIKRFKTPGSSDPKIPLHGNGKNKRSYLYIDDFVRAVDLLWNRMVRGECIGETFNIGAGVQDGEFELENIKLVGMICDYIIRSKLGIKDSYDLKSYIKFVADRNYNDSRYLLDSSKFRSQLGWSPQVDIRQGIELTVDQEFKEKTSLFHSIDL